MNTIIIFLLALFGFKGVYFPDFDYIAYSNPSAYIHEQGHRLDFYLDSISQTDEFKEAISILPMALENTSCIIKTEECIYREAYAKLWQAVDGNINNLPPELKLFYMEK